MEERRSYETVSEAVNDLISRGYTIDFSLEDEFLSSKGSSIRLQPEDFEIDEFHRFEGTSDPGDEMIVYAISSKENNLKGTFVSAFGLYSSTKNAKILKKLEKKQGIDNL